MADYEVPARYCHTCAAIVASEEHQLCERCGADLVTITAVATPLLPDSDNPMIWVTLTPHLDEHGRPFPR